MRRYIDRHINQKKYLSHSGPLYRSVYGWSDLLVSESLVYSHRRTDYEKMPFDETAHVHDYYELVLYVSGSVDYVTENTVFAPVPMAAVFFRPQELHNTRLYAPSVYERYVFYFYPSIFELDGKRHDFCEFLSEGDFGNYLEIPESRRGEITDILSRLDEEVSADGRNPLLIYLSVLRILEVLSHIPKTETSDDSRLPQKMLDVKSYIDENYASIPSVSAIANEFFYTREYISRLFKKYYNISVSDYLTRQRVMRSLDLMNDGASVTEAGFSVGFGSTSAFYLAFRKIMGMSPSEYLKRAKSN